MNRFKIAMGISLSLHIAGFWIYYVISNYESPIKLPPPSIQVQLTKLGKPRDENLLPRLDASKSISKPKPEHKPTKQISPLDLLKKRFGKPSDEGQKEGSLFGTSLSHELANSYELQVVELLRNNYEIPRILSPKEAKRLKLWIRLRISAQGKLIDIEVVKSSRNSRFDQAVLQGSQNIKSFGKPPLPLVKKYRNEGLLIQFCPLECS